MNEITLGFAGLGFLVVVQIGFFAVGYGRLKQKVEDICSRVIRLENRQNGTKRRQT